VTAGAVVGPLPLRGCETSTKLGDLFDSKNPEDPNASIAEPGASGNREQLPLGRRPFATRYSLLAIRSSPFYIPGS